MIAAFIIKIFLTDNDSRNIDGSGEMPMGVSPSLCCTQSDRALQKEEVSSVGHLTWAHLGYR